MAFSKLIGTYPLDSLVASNFGSASGVAWFQALPTSFNYAVQLKCGTLSGSGNLKAFLDHSLDDPNATANVNLVSLNALAAITTTSGVQTALAGGTPILPYVRLGVRCEAAGAGTTRFNGIVARIFTEG